MSVRVGRTSGPQVVLHSVRLLQRSQLPGLCGSKRDYRAHALQVICWCPQLMSRDLLTLSSWICGFYTLSQVSSVSWSPRRLYPLFFFVPSSPFHLSVCVAVCEFWGAAPGLFPRSRLLEVCKMLAVFPAHIVFRFCFLPNYSPSSPPIYSPTLSNCLHTQIWP